MTDHRRDRPEAPEEDSPEFSPVEPQRVPLALGARAVRPPAVKKPAPASNPTAAAPPQRGPGLLSLQRSQEVSLPPGTRQKWLQFQAPRATPAQLQDTAPPATGASTGATQKAPIPVGSTPTPPPTPMAWPTPGSEKNGGNASKKASQNKPRSPAQVRLSPWVVSGLFLLAAGGGWFGIRTFVGRLRPPPAHLEAATNSSKPELAGEARSDGAHEALVAGEAKVEGGNLAAAAPAATATSPEVALAAPPGAAGPSNTVFAAPVVIGAEPTGAMARDAETPAAPARAREGHRSGNRTNATKSTKRSSVLDSPIIDPDG